MPHVETPGRNPLIYTAMDILDFTFFINQPHHFISVGWQAVFIVWVYVCGNFQQTANLLFPRTAGFWRECRTVTLIDFDLWNALVCLKINHCFLLQ